MTNFHLCLIQKIFAFLFFWIGMFLSFKDRSFGYLRSQCLENNIVNFPKKKYNVVEHQAFQIRNF